MTDWFRMVWFCHITGLHQPKFVFAPTGTNIDQPGFYPSYRCELCGKELFN